MSNGKPRARTKERAVIEYSAEFLERIRQLKADIHRKYVEIGAEETPQYDGAGTQIVKKRPDGYDYIIEAYMRKKLDQHFPGWSWERPAGQLHFLGGEWVIGEGDLVIIDEYLVAFNIIPPLRRYHGTAAARIRYKSGATHTVENIIDVDIDVASANSRAFKRSINRLTNIGDDIYGKRIEEEGAGSIEEIIMMTEDSSQAQAMFHRYLGENHILVSKACAICSVRNIGEIKDYKEAYLKVKEAVEGGGE